MQLEPYTPWLNATEVKESKKGADWNQIQQKAPRHMDGFLNLEWCIISNAEHDNYKLNGEVWEMLISREMSNISQLCFPDKALRFGNYLGLSIDLGLVMKAKIITANGQVLHRLTCRLLTQDEWDSVKMEEV